MKKTILTLLTFVIAFAVASATPISNDLLKNRSIKFIENKGQIIDEFGNVARDVQFVAQVDFGLIIVKKNVISFSFVKPRESSAFNEKDIRDALLSKEPLKEQVFQFDVYRVDMKLLNSNLHPRIVAKEMGPDYDNYYLPHCPDGVTFVRNYKTIVLENVYPNIDFVIYGNKELKFQYDFVLKPGADPSQISFKFDGAQDVQITEKGLLKISTPFGSIEQEPPVAYQLTSLDKYTNSSEILSTAKFVESRFVKNSDNSISFVVENYDKSKNLIIDPKTRLWGTYYGGSSTEIGYTIYADRNGNSYITGYTSSSNNIATSGAFQTTINTTPDAFIVKFNANGVRQWGTYYGGNNSDYGFGISVDNSENVYFGGYTYSTNVIASSGAHQTSFAGSVDCFLVKLYSNGTRHWGTYYGGTDSDICYACAADASGNSYLAGYYTYSTSGIATSGAHQTSLSTTPDGFLVKFNTSGVRQWGTYYGGTSTDYIFGTVCDASGNVFIAGTTWSSAGIATSGVHQPSISTTPDAFLVKFNTNGVRQWGTYYGGNSTDYCYAMNADPNGNLYLTGYTSSTTGIASTGAFQTSVTTTPEAFVGKFNTNGSLVWGTYYGGNNSDYGMGVAADGSENVYLGGYTYSTDRIFTTDGFQRTLNSTPDGFLAMLSPDGRTRPAGTYYGGNSTDLIYYGCVSVDGQGNPFIGGYTYSTDVIASSNGHQTAVSATPEAWLAKFQGDIKQNDAGITGITSPVDKFNSYQPQPVRVILRNFGKFFPLTSVTINWSVDGVTQTPFQWTGNLDTGRTVEVTIHPSFLFTPRAPWGPIVIRAWTTNPRGPDAAANALPDADPTNDAFTRNVTPILNDAGFLNADGMLPIDPGVNVVRLRIRNYAPKPLTSVRISWWVNGVPQTPFDWTGNLAARDSIDVAVGTYDFGTANIPFYIRAATSNPNGFPDDDPSNDENTVMVYKALPGGTYTVGGRSPDFRTLLDFTSFIEYWGVAGPITVQIRPGTYQGGLTLKPVGYRQFPITFESSTGRNEDVIVEFTPTSSANNFVMLIDRLGSITFRNLTIRNNSCSFGNVIRITGGVKGLTIDNCVIVGCSNPSRNNNFALIFSDANLLESLTITNSTFRNGSVAIWQVSPTGQTSRNYNISNNIFTSQNWYGLYLDGVDLVNIIDNTITGVNLVYGIYFRSSGLPLVSFDDKNQSESPLSTPYVFRNNRIGGVGPATSTALTNPNAGLTIVNSFYPVQISKNTIMTTNTNGIYVENVGNLSIVENEFTSSSTGTNNKSSIIVRNSGAQALLVEKNFANNSNNKGIYIENSSNAKIYRNYVKLSGGNYGLHLLNSSAVIANNIVTTSGSGALYLDGVRNTIMVYNTYFGTNTGPISYLNNLGLGTGNLFKRNMVYNRGTGNAFQIWGTPPAAGSVISDENNFYTAGTVLVGGIFGNIANLAGWRSATGMDMNSVSVTYEFLSVDYPMVARIDPALYFRNPLYELGALADEVEKYDYNGEQRLKAFYIGVNSLNPVIRIVTQPKEIVDCVGATGKFFSVVATIDFGGTLSYQWYKGGVEIPGANQAIYNLPALRHDMADVYRCRITGTGEAEPVWTEPVLLYAVERTNITRQPKQVYANMGGVATFEIDVHISDNPLLQPKIQWYRGNTALRNSDRIAGATSSILTIRDIRPADLGANYYVIVEGICGRDTSDLITLAEKPKVLGQPLNDVQVCEGQTVSITVNAVSSVAGYTLKYQWRFNGLPLEDGGKYSGTNTSTLTITNAGPENSGLYDVVVSIEGFDKATFGPANLLVFMKPRITKNLPPNVSLNVGQTLRLTIEASGDNLQYRWFKDGVELNQTNATLEITNVQTDDAGKYKVRVYNNCGEVFSSECEVTVTFRTILDVPEESETFELFQSVPNPTDGKAKIEFYIPSSGFAKLTISTLVGDKVFSLANGHFEAGLHSVVFDAVAMNFGSGVYIYTLEFNGKKLSRQLVLVR